MIEACTLATAEATSDTERIAFLASLRRSTQRWRHERNHRGRLPSGVPELDALLAGGWPQGKVGELVGPASSGRTGIVTATAAAATQRSEVVAWIDAADTLAPFSVAAAGADLERVLWIRPAGIDVAVRAAELVLETGDFAVVVLDLARPSPQGSGRRAQGAGPPPYPPSSTQEDGAPEWVDERYPSPGALSPCLPVPGARCPAPGWRGGGAALRLRLVRATERAGAVVLVLSDRSWVGTMAGATVTLNRSRALWSARSRGTPCWLAGLEGYLRVERGGCGAVGRPIEFRLSCSEADTDGGSDADRLLVDPRFSPASLAAG